MGHLDAVDHGDVVSMNTTGQEQYPKQQKKAILHRKTLVRLAGLEPARLAPLPPQSSVSANSTISAPSDNPQHAKVICKAQVPLRLVGPE